VGRHSIRRAAVAAYLAAAALAAPAAAWGADPPAPSGPADGARVVAGSPVALKARGVAGEASLVLRISRSPQPIDACGRIGGEVANAAGVAAAADLALYDFAAGRWYDQPGTYFWQVARTAPDGTCAVAPPRTLIVLAPGAAPAQRPRAGTPLPRLSRAPIPRRIGASNHVTFVIRTGGLPARVSRSRYLSLVRNSGRRWRLHSGGTQPGRPVFGNGRSEVGFATRLVPRGALAATITGPDFRAGSVGRLERDLVLRADLPWQEGPVHPDRTQIDLETVLLHEFGHMAGNRGHAGRGCRDTPMIIGLARGEWWRSSRDFSFRSCPSGPS
jgi:hypothetical protein